MHRLVTLARRLTAGYGAVVMATGILSVDFLLLGYRALSLALLVTALLVWAALAVLFVIRLVVDRAGWLQAAHRPGALTAVAGTAVLGTRFSPLRGPVVPAVVLAGCAGLLAVLLPLVVRHLRRGSHGAVFLVCVATESVAVLAVAPALVRRVAWLPAAGLALFAAGLVLYLVAQARFSWGDVEHGPGDQWIAAGALAASTVAGAHLLLAPGGWPDAVGTLLRVVTAVVWALAAVGFAVLAAGELADRCWDYHVQRWATVFPVGMMAAATDGLARVARLAPLHPVAVALAFAGLLLWAVVTTGALRHRSPAPTPQPR